MTNNEINIRIAEICGWTEIKNLQSPKLAFSTVGKPPGGGTITNIPNYAGCLNACHEMEKTLGYKEHRAFGDDLWDICETPAGDIMDDKWAIAHASPLQRCEAFLRVHGKWEETKQETV